MKFNHSEEELKKKFTDPHSNLNQVKKEFLGYLEHTYKKDYNDYIAGNKEKKSLMEKLVCFLKEMISKIENLKAEDNDNSTLYAARTRAIKDSAKEFCNHSFELILEKQILDTIHIFPIQNKIKNYFQQRHQTRIPHKDARKLVDEIKKFSNQVGKLTALYIIKYIFNQEETKNQNASNILKTEIKKLMPGAETWEDAILISYYSTSIKSSKKKFTGINFQSNPESQIEKRFKIEKRKKKPGDLKKTPSFSQSQRKSTKKGLPKYENNIISGTTYCTASMTDLYPKNYLMRERKKPNIENDQRHNSNDSKEWEKTGIYLYKDKAPSKKIYAMLIHRYYSIVIELTDKYLTLLPESLDWPSEDHTIDRAPVTLSEDFLNAIHLHPEIPKEIKELLQKRKKYNNFYQSNDAAQIAYTKNGFIIAISDGTSHGDGRTALAAERACSVAIQTLAQEKYSHPKNLETDLTSNNKINLCNQLSTLIRSDFKQTDKTGTKLSVIRGYYQPKTNKIQVIGFTVGDSMIISYDPSQKTFQQILEVKEVDSKSTTLRGAAGTRTITEPSFRERDIVTTNKELNENCILLAITDGCYENNALPTISQPIIFTDGIKGQAITLDCSKLKHNFDKITDNNDEIAQKIFRLALQNTKKQKFTDLDNNKQSSRIGDDVTILQFGGPDEIIHYKKLLSKEENLGKKLEKLKIFQKKINLLKDAWETIKQNEQNKFSSLFGFFRKKWIENLDQEINKLEGKLNGSPNLISRLIDHDEIIEAPISFNRIFSTCLIVLLFDSQNDNRIIQLSNYLLKLFDQKDKIETIRGAINSEELHLSENEIFAKAFIREQAENLFNILQDSKNEDSEEAINNFYLKIKIFKLLHQGSHNPFAQVKNTKKQDLQKEFIKECLFMVSKLDRKTHAEEFETEQFNSLFKRISSLNLANLSEIHSIIETLLYCGVNRLHTLKKKSIIDTNFLKNLSNLIKGTTHIKLLLPKLIPIFIAINDDIELYDKEKKLGINPIRHKNSEKEDEENKIDFYKKGAVKFLDYIKRTVEKNERVIFNQIKLFINDVSVYFSKNCKLMQKKKGVLSKIYLQMVNLFEAHLKALSIPQEKTDIFLKKINKRTIFSHDAPLKYLENEINEILPQKLIKKNSMLLTTEINNPTSENSEKTLSEDTDTPSEKNEYDLSSMMQ